MNKIEVPEKPTIRRLPDDTFKHLQESASKLKALFPKQFKVETDFNKYYKDYRSVYDTTKRGSRSRYAKAFKENARSDYIFEVIREMFRVVNTELRYARQKQSRDDKVLVDFNLTAITNAEYYVKRPKALIDILVTKGTSASQVLSKDAGRIKWNEPEKERLKIFEDLLKISKDLDERPVYDMQKDDAYRLDIYADITRKIERARVTRADTSSYAYIAYYNLLKSLAMSGLMDELEVIYQMDVKDVLKFWKDNRNEVDLTFVYRYASNVTHGVNIKLYEFITSRPDIQKRINPDLLERLIQDSYEDGEEYYEI